MAILGKKTEFSKYSREELERMRDECISKLNATAGSYREPDSLASTIKDSGTYGLRMMSGSHNDRRYWQNRLDAIDLAIKEKESPKKKIEEFRAKTAEVMRELRRNPSNDKAAEELQAIQFERLAWLCGIAGISDGAKISVEKRAELETLISAIEGSMNRGAEHYVDLLELIERGVKNARQPISNYDRQVDDFSQHIALSDMAALNKIKELEQFKNEKGSKGRGTKSRTSKTQVATPKGMRRREERLERFMDIKDGIAGYERLQ